MRKWWRRLQPPTSAFPLGDISKIQVQASAKSHLRSSAVRNFRADYQSELTSSSFCSHWQEVILDWRATKKSSSSCELFLAMTDIRVQRTLYDPNPSAYSAFNKLSSAFDNSTSTLQSSFKVRVCFGQRQVADVEETSNHCHLCVFTTSKLLDWSGARREKYKTQSDHSLLVIMIMLGDQAVGRKSDNSLPKNEQAARQGKTNFESDRARSFDSGDRPLAGVFLRYRPGTA